MLRLAPAADPACPPRPAQLAPARLSRRLPLRVERLPFDALADLGPAMRSLAQNAVEPNVFYEHGPLGLAAGCLGGAAPALLTVRDDSAGGRLVGCLPVQATRWFRALPLAGLRNYAHPYCFLASPLVWRDYEAGFWSALLDWFKAAEASVLELGGLRADGELFACLQRALAADPALVCEQRGHARALLHSSLAARDYLAGSLSAKHAKELRRLQRRLAEVGRVQSRFLAQDEALSPWLDDFLALETQGWKGRRGTAMACAASHSAFFQRLCRELHREGRLAMARLDLDGRAIAMQVTLRAGSGLFAFRIAFDEDYRAFSPGVLLQHALTGQVLDRGRGEWVDSCAEPDHPMIDRLWRERRRIGAVTIMRRGAGSTLVLGLYRSARALRAALVGTRRTPA